MTRYARRPKRGGRWNWLSRGLSGVGAAVARNPAAVGGTSAFLVSLAFVSANALFYQPQMHPNAFVSTRGPAVPAVETETEAEPPLPTAAPRREVLDVAPGREETAAAASMPESTGSVPEPSGDDTVRAVQTVLSELGLYRGEIDGMEGPQTHAAIETYRRIVGLEGGSNIDAALLRQLGLEEPGPSGHRVAPAPRPAGQADEAKIQTASLGSGNETVRRVQEGLKAFGNDDIEIDGIMGARTRQAITEFQSLFGLPVTGEPDKALLTKMREIGLIS